MDINKVMASLSQSGVLGGFAGGLAGGAATSALLSKRGRKNATKLLKVGGLAAVGGLAWKAYHSYQQKQAAGQNAGADRPLNNVAPARFVALGDAVTPQSESMLVIRAMIAAALADRQLDADEQRRIFEQLDQAALTPAERASLFEELRNPAPIDQLVAGVDDAETAIEVYAASLLAVDPTTPANQSYLQQLAAVLQLPGKLIEELHANLAAQQATTQAA